MLKPCLSHGTFAGGTPGEAEGSWCLGASGGGGGFQRSLVPWPFGIVGVYEVQAALRYLDSGSFGFMVEGPRL